MFDMCHQTPYTGGMEKNEQLGVRVPASLRRALAIAAQDDTRSVSSLVQKVLGDWLRMRGYEWQATQQSVEATDDASAQRTGHGRRS